MSYDKKCKWHKSCGYDFCHGEGICPEFEEEMERDAIERAIKALEKQVPQKVKKYKGLNETACPECGIAFGYYEYDDEKFDYCYNCGQKLDWESEVEHNA
jgi:hypothetical protein